MELQRTTILRHSLGRLIAAEFEGRWAHW